MKQYSEEEIERIMKQYKLSDEDHDRIFEDIKRIWHTDPFPVEKPKAIIIGGQTGSGKTGIIAHSIAQFEDRNVVVINSDEIKPFHPKSSEIARLYPDLYTKVTDQESNTWTSDLFEATMVGKYNLIFEGTMKNSRILGTMRRLKSLGYEVTVRGLSVCDLESMLSVLERYTAQVEKKGWGRLVVPEHHYETYRGMPETVGEIEESGVPDKIEIFRRGTHPARPVLIYSEEEPFGFENAKDAVLRGREQDIIRTLPTFEERARKINESMLARDADLEEQKILLDLLEHYRETKEGIDAQKKSLTANKKEELDTSTQGDER